MFNKLLTIFLLCLTLAVASPLVKRDAATVLADISTIGTDLTTLDGLVQGFNGNVANAVPIANAETTAENDLKKAISDTDASSAFSDSDSTSVTNALLNLTPNINQTINDLVAKACTACISVYF